MTYWEIMFELGKLGTLALLLISAIAWFARAVFRQILSRDLEKFKSGLEMEAMTHKIRYERLHGERVEVIKEVYQKIVQADSSLRFLVKIFHPIYEPPLEKKEESAVRHCNDLTGYYERNRIFFEESLAKDIDDILDSFHRAWTSYQAYKEAGGGRDPDGALEASREITEQMGKTAPKVRKQLETKFRNILGIDNE